MNIRVEHGDCLKVMRLLVAEGVQVDSVLTDPTGAAAMRGGFRSILIEREAEYIADIKRRIAHQRGAETARARRPERMRAHRMALEASMTEQVNG